MYDHFGNKKNSIFDQILLFGAVFGWLTWEWLKRRFLTLNLSKFFGQLDVIKQLFLSFEHFETKFVFFCGGGGEESVFNVLSSHSFFSFCHPFLQPVLLPTLLSFLCAEFWLATFSGKKGKE